MWLCLTPCSTSTAGYLAARGGTAKPLVKRRVSLARRAARVLGAGRALRDPQAALPAALHKAAGGASAAVENGAGRHPGSRQSLPSAGAHACDRGQVAVQGGPCPECQRGLAFVNALHIRRSGSACTCELACVRRLCMIV